MCLFEFSHGVGSTEPQSLVRSLGYLVSNGRRVLLGGIRLGGSAIVKQQVEGGSGGQGRGTQGD
jgi:hypothetical protein